MICLVIRGTASSRSPFIKLLFRNYSFFNYKKKKEILQNQQKVSLSQVVLSSVNLFQTPTTRRVKTTRVKTRNGELESENQQKPSDLRGRYLKERNKENEFKNTEETNKATRPKRG